MATQIVLQQVNSSRTNNTVAAEKSELYANPVAGGEPETEEKPLFSSVLKGKMDNEAVEPEQKQATPLEQSIDEGELTKIEAELIIEEAGSVLPAQEVREGELLPEIIAPGERISERARGRSPVGRDRRNP